MPRLLIDDGYTFEFTSTPTDRTKEGVTIKYRPPTLADVTKFDDASIHGGDIKANATAEHLAKHIGEWNVVAGEGETEKPVPITKDTFLKIRDWALIGQLVKAINGTGEAVAAEQKK